MTYRTLPDPHEPAYCWRVVDGYRQWSGWDTPGLFLRLTFGLEPDTRLVTPTPERVALWMDLALNPTD